MTGNSTENILDKKFGLKLPIGHEGEKELKELVGDYFYLKYGARAYAETYRPLIAALFGATS